MSRAYRIKVRECLQLDLQAEDSITTHLELLEILPAEEMGALLNAELQRRGFERDGDVLVRPDGDITVTVEPCTGTVTVRAEKNQQVQLESDREGIAWDDSGPSQRAVRERLEQDVRKDLTRKATKKEAHLQEEATTTLEGHLAQVQKELNEIANKVTADALKQKAATLGRITEMVEDPESGSLTITLEV